MFINKINSGIDSRSFKGYQYEKNSVGETVMHFNYPYDYSKKKGYVDFYKVRKNDNAYAGYEVIKGSPIARLELKEQGNLINLGDIAGLDKDEAFAYSVVIEGEAPVADSGVKIDSYTLVTRKGTTPMVQGAGYLAFPDGQRVGVAYKGFDDPDTGKIYLDKNKQKEMENTIRTFSNKFDGNIAGLEYNIDYLKENGYKVQYTNPLAGGDNKSSHHYWNKNNMQISDDMGNLENFASYTRKLFQNGIKYVYDGTFTSEGLEGIHFQYALRWADKNPQSYYWFKMSGIKDSNLGLGVVPKNKENLRHRVVNAPVIYNADTKKIEANPNYNSMKETLFQVYDASQVTDEQLSKLDKPIETYKNLRNGNLLSINSHDDTVINYICEVSPEEYKKRLEDFIDFNKNNDNPVELNSPDGTILVAQFSNFKIDKKTEGGFVAWDANTDMVKMNYQVSGYDEKINQAIVSRSQRDYEKNMQLRGAYEVQDMAVQAGKYWTAKFKDIQTLYTAQTLKNAVKQESIDSMIESGLLPKEARLSQEALTNIQNGYYNLVPKGILEKDDVTMKALMRLPLDSLEFAENTVGVLSTSYFSNRATTEDTIGMTRFDLMKKENPHLVEVYAKTYLKTNGFFAHEIKNFADEIIKKVDESSAEKLLDSNGDYTEYGEYVIELLGQDIAKYAFLKSLAGSDLKTKILSNGEITYDYKELKNITTLKSLGINANNPTDEASQLANLIEKGLSRLDNNDIDYVVKSLKQRINGTNTNSFRIAEAIVDKASLGLDWRLDAAKDVMDQDAVRNGDNTFDEGWQGVIDFWSKFVKAVKSENPNSYIVAEITDMDELVRSTMGEFSNGYDDMPDIGAKYKTVKDALIKFYNETGITSEAAYSYFFTDLLKTFSAEFESGSMNLSNGRFTTFIGKVNELIDTRGIDYVRNLFTFSGNHDKPRIIHGLALDMGLFHGDFDIFKQDGAVDFEQNRSHRLEALLQLTNSDRIEDLPLEARLNIDNTEYFRTVSTRAVAMSQLLRSAINETLGRIASEEEIKYLKLALADLTNGNFLGSGSNTNMSTINIPELSSLENALKKILEMAGVTLSKAEFDAIIKEANDQELLEKYQLQGDFDWGGVNESIGVMNQNRIEFLLRGADSLTPSGEWDYMKYSLYTANLTAILKEAFLRVKDSKDPNSVAFLNAGRDFIKKYDRATVNASRTALPTFESYPDAMKKNGYAARDIKTAVQMLVDQAEFRARKDGKLGTQQHFANSQDIVVNVYKNATEPAAQKAIMMMSFLSALVGIPTIYGGDELGMSGYEEKAKNVYLQNRNALPWSELENGPFKEYRERILKGMNGALGIRSRDGVEALNFGTPYKLDTSDKNIPAFLMQDGHGNMTISVFNATAIMPQSKFDYHAKYGINDKNKDKFYADNKIESINKNNRFVPIQPNYDIDHILLGAGISLPIGLTFMNSDIRDKAVYVVKEIGGKLGICNKNGGKIALNGITAKNGAMVLKHLTFKGKDLNQKYNIVANPYQKTIVANDGAKFSIIAG